MVETPSQTVGPFFTVGLCVREQAQLVAPGSDGAISIHGQVLDGRDDPVSDALVEIWHADPDGAYREAWGRCGTDPDGRYAFLTTKPGGEGQAPHVLVLVFARGLLKPVLTRLYFPDEEAANAGDAVLSAVPDPAERATLIAIAEDGGYRFDVRLQGPGQTAFFA